jgi:ankyrin repeat protein
MIITETIIDIYTKLNLIEILIKRGADINTTYDDNDVLTSIIKSDDSELLLDSLFKFIKQYETVNINNISSYKLCLCIELDKLHIFRILLEYGQHNGIIDVNNYNEQYDRPIFTYLSTINKDNQKLYILNELLKYDLDINVYNKEGKTPLHISIENHYNNCTILLLKHNDNPYILDKSGNTLLISAIKYSNIEMVNKLYIMKDLININNNKSLSPLFYSLYCNKSIDIFNLLIDNPNINLKWYDTDGRDIIYHIINCHKLDSMDKVRMVTSLFEKDSYTNEMKEPYLIQTIINNQYDLTKLIFKYYMKKGIIKLYNKDKLIDVSQLDSMINMKVEHTILIKTDHRINYYPLVYKFLLINNINLIEIEKDEEPDNAFGIYESDISEENDIYDNIIVIRLMVIIIFYIVLYLVLTDLNKRYVTFIRDMNRSVFIESTIDSRSIRLTELSEEINKVLNRRRR